ncbi:MULTISPECIES: hypothetical protein [Rhizobium/Agrobacterium group]|uniref:hypothetical protein n=1 Tax=Rhizobium oryzihabitans TaxID=2267833 RepID=UPI004033248A
MPPFSTTNTQDADDAEIVAFAQAKSAHQRAVAKSEEHQAALRKYRIANQLSVLMMGILAMMIVVAAVKADRFYKREALISQENVAWNR